MKISKLMTRDVMTCRTIDMLDRAAQLMWDHDIGCLPIIDERGRIAGIITDRDICMAAYTRGAPLHAINVADAMSAHPAACSQDAELSTVEAEMCRRQIHRMPVVDDEGHPVGIVSLSDIARAAQELSEISPGEIAATLAAVSAPRLAAIVGES